MAECSGFIVDVSSQMIQHDRVSKVQAYLEYSLLEKCKRKRKTDWISCYLANCAISKNSQSIDGVFQVQDWVAPVSITETLRVLRQLQSYSQDLRDGNVTSLSNAASSSMVQCLLVSSLDCREHFRVRKMRRQLVVFTDDMEGLDLSSEEVEVLTEELNLSILLVDCRTENHRGVSATLDYGVWGKLVEVIEGSRIYHINDLLREISSLPSDVVKPVTVFSGELRLGTAVTEHNDQDSQEDEHSLTIRVEGYPATKAVPSISRKMVVKREIHGKDFYKPVKSVVEYDIQGSEESSLPIQVSPNSITKAYRYGSDYVVLPSSLENQPREYTNRPGIDIMGFIDQDALPRHYLHSESRFITADTRYGGIHDVVALTALVDALRCSNQLAIVRFVAKPTSDVQIGILCPIHVEDYHALVYCRLPFAEDQRVAEFPRLVSRTTTSGKKIEEGESQGDIDSLMSQYIDAFSMDDKPETKENNYFKLTQGPSPTNLPLPQHTSYSGGVKSETGVTNEDPLMVPAIHLHRVQQVLLEWIHLCIINESKFHVPEMPDFLANKISSCYEPSPELDESIVQLKKLLGIKKSRRRRFSRESQEEENEDIDEDIPDLQSLLLRGQRQ
ncbi:ATP-dependent DNA helicase II subunit 2 [Zygosaccharomyces mellis]|uniref:ATP-dependent DNA helicase II subunit 2 n=1 Tax=Zygosaccharomyces mellis TaxID=42258 RepID=A0A4C2E5Y4_9SACH|nr:ATP-dependent DNA helicase II subunit 2 [Zygosaccharomyces mellis]